MHVQHPVLATGVAVALGAAGLATNVAAAALYATAAPYAGFLALVRTVLPGVAFAASAIAVAVLRRGGAGPIALVAGSFALAAPALSVGLAQRSSAWIAVGAVAQLAVPAIVLVALLFPTGRLRGRVRRAVAALVVLVGLVM